MYNIYTNKNYKLYVIVPILLLIISLFFIPKIIMDTTLTGGTTLEFTSNTTLTPRALTSSMDSIIPGTSVTISKISTVKHISMVFLPNKSISTGSTYLLNLTKYYSNYSQYQANIAIQEGQLSANPSNLTAKTALSSYQANSSSELINMSKSLSLELSSLKPFINSSYYKFNSSNATDMLNVGTNANNNASTSYKAYLIKTARTVIPFSTYSYDTITPTLGAFFLNKVINIIIVAFIIVAIVVFIIFRTPIPSFAIIFGAANDIIIALGAMGIFHIELGVASVGGLLMLIGYAIDTEVLSSVRVLKRTDGTNEERAFQSMKTGLTMTGAAIITFGMLFAVSYIAFIPEYIEISGVVLFGLIGDIFTAWLGNTAMVLWYKNKRDARWQR